MIKPSPIAVFKDWVDSDTDMRGVLDEARYEAFLWGVEQALVRFADGRSALITGDIGRITFELNADRRVIIMVEGRQLPVTELVWHTHPRVTGPSDGDFDMLRVLNQSSSRIYEAGGGIEGTQFFRKDKP